MIACGGVEIERENVFLPQEIDFIVEGILQIDQLQLQKLEQEIQAKSSTPLSEQHQGHFPNTVEKELPSAANTTHAALAPDALEANTMQAQT